ncbi:MAG: hypothetical protein JST87_18295 [Bacteroidetes bacterium]|nr:hypothetical protein [Bacteroidota bacterium]
MQELNMYSFRISFFLLLSVATVQLNAQQFGGNPPSLKWNQINTDTARIIFPKGLETQALQVASIVHALSNATLQTAGGHQRKINIIFQNQTTISNAYVSLAPFRSEFQLTAAQNSLDLGSLPWQQQLAIHEYRHVQQYNNYRIGVSKVLYYLFGEGGQELGNSLAIPNWYWEGDAVYQETLVSNQGRGRLPFFFNGYRSLWAAEKKYSWMKLRNGSLRDYVPDHYPLGYMLVAYGREKYGDDFWRNVTLDAASFKGLFYPLQKGIKKYAGISFDQFRDNALHYFNGQQPKSTETDSAHMHTREQKHFVADEEFPQFIDHEHIVFVKTTYRKIPAFVERNILTGKERVIKNRAISLDNYFSCKNGMVVYAAYETDARWSWRDFSVIHLLDLKTGIDKKISARTKYFSPDISATGDKVVAVNVRPDGKSELVILNSSSGEIENTIPNKDSLFYTYPKFYNEHQLISAVRNQLGEMSLAVIDDRDGSAKYLLPFSMNPVAFLSVQKDTVFFSATHNGRDDLFSFVNDHLYQIILPVKNDETGNYQLAASDGYYAWNSFTAVGYTIHNSDKEHMQFREISATEFAVPLITQQVHSLEKDPADLLNKISFGQYSVSKYSQSFNLFNFHSWRPYIDDPDYSFSLVSENVLNTMESELFAEYNRNEGYKRVGVDATYGQLFPWIDAGLNYTFDRNGLYRNQKVFWNEAQVNAGMSIPLHFVKNKTSTSLQFGSDVIYNKRYYTGFFKDTFSNKAFTYVDPFIFFSNQVQQAQMQIYPRFAQTLTLSYNRAITTFSGNQFLASGYIYLPGISYTHSLVLSAAFQQRDSLNNIIFSNNFPFSRGYSSENFYRMYRFGGNYNFPLAYPDWGFGDIVYFLRIRANLFFDYTKALDFFTNGARFEPTYRSVGTEIYFDTKWWNQLSISFGFRYSHLLDPDFEGRGPNQWEFILPINLLSK